MLVKNWIDFSARLTSTQQGRMIACGTTCTMLGMVFYWHRQNYVYIPDKVWERARLANEACKEADAKKAAAHGHH